MGLPFIAVDTPTGKKITLAQVARVDYGTGPNTINRENVSRLIVVSANATGRDLRSLVDEIKQTIKQQVQFPSGYFPIYNAKLLAGISMQETIIKGSSERLAAILITALTSALGMLPLVVSGGAGKEILQPLAVVVLGGLFTSTALTLLILPALYSQFGKYLMPNQSEAIAATKSIELEEANV